MRRPPASWLLVADIGARANSSGNFLLYLRAGRAQRSDSAGANGTARIQALGARAQTHSPLASDYKCARVRLRARLALNLHLVLASPNWRPRAGSRAHQIARETTIVIWLADHLTLDAARAQPARLVYT